MHLSFEWPRWGGPYPKREAGVFREAAKTPELVLSRNLHEWSHPWLLRRYKNELPFQNSYAVIPLTVSMRRSGDDFLGRRIARKESVVEASSDEHFST